MKKNKEIVDKEKSTSVKTEKKDKKTSKKKTTKSSTGSESTNKTEEKVVAEKIEYYTNYKKFDFVKACTIFLAIIFVLCIGIVIAKVATSLNDQDSFHSVSLKEYKYVSDKTEALNNAYSMLNDVSKNEVELDPSNLNIAKLNAKVTDEEDIRLAALNRNLPIPVTLDEEKSEEVEEKTAAFQIYEKLQNRYQVLQKALYNLCDMNPVMIVREYHYDGYSIIGEYNPEDPSHVKGKRHTWFIPNFSNVNIEYYDGDGVKLSDDNNIKDIMSMASVYTYYHDPYDYNTFLKYCYNLFDNSYNYVASISEVYYCSGCVHYPEASVATSGVIKKDTSIHKINRTHSEQKVPDKDVPYKAGHLTKMKEDTYSVDDGTYDEYVDNVINGKNVSYNNYCPGHIDLNIHVQVLTLDATNGLSSIDRDYGNKGMLYNKDWHGWDALMLNRARKLYYKDWEKEYGLSVSYIDFVKPLTQEEINYYLNRLDKSLTPNRKKVIEIALRSVGKIPYYYGGKTSRGGYEGNYFGTKVLSDYKGRCLKGLDCSGWINWVYMTAFNKYIIKSEGTSKLAGEGTKITRKELLPGDIIVRPGADSHVMMFLEWAPDGRMKVIHENGSVNNVCIGTFEAYYPHYRRIINT